MRRLPVAVRFMLLHGLLGFGLAGVLLGAILWADPGGVGRLLLAAEGHPGPALLLWFFLGLTLGSAQIGAAVMLRELEPAPPRRWPPPLPEETPGPPRA
jgi:uncharacterized membrane protein YedE/YeeE